MNLLAYWAFCPVSDPINFFDMQMHQVRNVEAIHELPLR